MNSTVFSRVSRAVRIVARAACSQPLPSGYPGSGLGLFGWKSAGLACLGLALAGCGGLNSALQEQAVQAANRSVRYTIQDLGVVGANFFQPGQPYVISNSGWISGEALVGSAEQAVLWHGGQMIPIGNPGLNSYALGVNESGTAAGATETTAAGLSTTEDFCGFQAGGFSSSPTPLPCVPFVWTGSTMLPLPTLGGVNGGANEINNSGSIAGYAENKTLDPGCTAAQAGPQKYQFKPVVWNHGAIQALPTGNDAEGVAISINDHGQIVGVSGSCAPLNPVWLFYLAMKHALLWQNGAATDLGNLGGEINNVAHHINNLGQVVGQSDLVGDQTAHAFLWPGPDNKMQDLETVQDSVDNDTFSLGLGINDAGEITGVSSNADSSIIRAFVRRNGKLVDLNSLIVGSNPFPQSFSTSVGPTGLVTACSITSKGEIIGIAIDPNGETHGYLAVPAP
jgi:probable HAF family extracellular repeat protein